MKKQPAPARQGIPEGLKASIAIGRRTLARAPDDPQALAALARLLMTVGAFEEAAQHLQRALRLAPQRAELRADAVRIAHILCVRGDARARADDAEGVIRAYGSAISVRPECPVQVYLALGARLQQRGDLRQARAVYRRACAAHPERPAPYIRLGWVLHAMRRIEPAIAALRRAVEVSPGNARALRELAEILIKERTSLDEALAICRRIQALEPENPDAVANVAAVLELQGEVLPAYELLRPLLTAAKRTPHLVLVFATVCERLEPPSDEALEPLETVLAMPDLDGEARARLQRAKASLCDALGRADDAFRAIEASKRGEAGRDAQSKAELLGVIERTLNCFTRARMAAMPRARHGSELPVFIVGMPRSGTSLVEQILDAHPLAYGAGELTTMIGFARTRLGVEADYPACFDAWTQERLDDWAGRYLAQLQALAPAAQRVTDKMPFNFIHLGMIELLFPRARVIHCARNPLDTCVSCYFNEFSTNLSIFNDLPTLGRYYRRYRELMRHWQGVLSLPVFELRYEELLADPERVVRALLEFCGLDWNDACLDFHRSRRPVKTFSYHQVRKPLYATSVGRYRAYEKYLGALKSALGEALVAEAEGAA